MLTCDQVREEEFTHRLVSFFDIFEEYFGEMHNGLCSDDMLGDNDAVCFCGKCISMNYLDLIFSIAVVFSYRKSPG